MTKNKYYLTTAIPYVNGRPHLGHALEYVVADAIHRYKELSGNKVFFVSGADENALKNVQAAEKEDTPIQEFLDKNSKGFEDFYKMLGVELDEFRRGSDQKLHWPGVTKLWKLVEENGDLYKKRYKGLYCVGCASFKTEKELVDGKCQDHDKKPEVVEEENWFFKLSKYQKRLEKLIETDEYKIFPQKRKNEILSFIRGGLEDFSVSRSIKRARGVGVPVPNDPSQAMYVWFDALTIYMTAVGYGYDEDSWKKLWPANLHIIGKDLIRFHAVYWPAMLLSAKLPLPKELLVHGFIDSGGRKMSKTIGNVIDPYEVLDKYGLEPLRYYLLREIPTLDDGDFTYKRFEQVYQADLANGIGNLVARLAKLCEKIEYTSDYKPALSSKYEKDFSNYQLNSVLQVINVQIRSLDKYINDNKPWTINDKGKLKKVLKPAVDRINQIAFELRPFLPETAKKIEKQFKGPKIKSGKPLFPRLD